MEQKIQMLIPIVLRTVGPIFLRSGLGGLGGAGANNSPSFDDDDEDDDNNDDDDNKESKDDNSISGANGRKVSISLPTFPPDDDDDDDEDDDVEEINDNKTNQDNKKESRSENDQGTSSTHNIPSIVSPSTSSPEALYPNIDLSVFDPEPSSSTTTEANHSAVKNDESPDSSDAILDKIALRQNDAAYLGSAPYVYELPPHQLDCENETKNNEFNSVR